MAFGTIRLLSDDVANKIAAGEVVERPASVVKELVENAIDAGATHVAVRLEQAGKRLILVEDDGAGMAREDALLSLERHATSKIVDAADLDKIHTLGFRGEALPSIASVSRLRMTSRPFGSDEATEVRVEGGRVMGSAAAGSAPGTRVEVEELFFNVPARRKFLKSDATELRNVVETLTHLALIHPGIGFELVNGARALLHLPPGQSHRERAAELSAAEELHWAEDEAGGKVFRFAFAPPHQGRGHRKGVRLFVNRRAVNDRMLFRAVMEGYKGLIESGRYPEATLWLELPPDEVDVNVHPAKREVRFRDEGRVFRWVAGRVAETLSGAAWVREPAEAGQPQDPWGVGEADAGASRVADALEAYAARASCGAAQPRYVRPAGAPGRGNATGPSPGSLTGRPVGLPLEQGVGGPATTPLSDILPSSFGPLRFLGSFDATYLLFEEQQSRQLVLVDQHAAHERILYEKLLAGAGAEAEGQPLLVPVVVECGVEQMASHEERKAALERLGLFAEPFGARSLSVSHAPAGMSAGQVEAMVLDLLGGEPPEVQGDPGEEAARTWAARAACSAAVKARTALEFSEVAALIRQLDGCDNPGHCPHGRPLVVRMTRGQVEGLFHRR